MQAQAAAWQNALPESWRLFNRAEDARRQGQVGAERSGKVDGPLD